MSIITSILTAVTYIIILAACTILGIGAILRLISAGKEFIQLVKEEW